MGNIVKTAQCRFCGQMVQIETDKELHRGGRVSERETEERKGNDECVCLVWRERSTGQEMR